MRGKFRCLYVVGARPQFIKLAPLVRAMSGVSQEYIVHTGQHYDRAMSSLLFEELGIPEPAVNLGIGSGAQGAQTGRMLSGLEAEMERAKPACVVIFGDTNSTLAGALAAVKLGIPCVHVEAGLRSWNRTMPEEINRVVADHVSSHLFAPTETAMENLAREGLAARSLLTGDIMVDALRDNLAVARTKGLQIAELAPDRPFTLVTLHRPYNVDMGENLRQIVQNLGALSGQVLFPIHPRTRRIMDEHAIELPGNFVATEPLGYLEFLCAEGLCSRVVTDSGGVQKEAYLLGKPCITLRPETEWVETIENGWNILADPLSAGLAHTVESFAPSGQPAPVFGEKVAERMRDKIVTIVENTL